MSCETRCSPSRKDAPATSPLRLGHDRQQGARNSQSMHHRRCGGARQTTSIWSESYDVISHRSSIRMCRRGTCGGLLGLVDESARRGGRHGQRSDGPLFRDVGGDQECLERSFAAGGNVTRAVAKDDVQDTTGEGRVLPSLSPEHDVGGGPVLGAVHPSFWDPATRGLRHHRRQRSSRRSPPSSPRRGDPRSPGSPRRQERRSTGSRSHRV
jgi:hypothetical protein